MYLDLVTLLSCKFIINVTDFYTNIYLQKAVFCNLSNTKSKNYQA